MGATPRRAAAGRFCHATAAAKTVAARRRRPLCHGVAGWGAARIYV